MRVVILLLLSVFVTCCDSPQIEKPDRPQNAILSRKEVLANQVTKLALAKLKTDKELIPFGSGGGMMDQIKMLALAFHYHKPVDIEKARELLVESTTLFLKIINDNEDIRPYLENYPFTSENIEIRIYLQNPDRSKPDPGNLTTAVMLNGTLEYVIRNPETNRLKTIYEEPFEDARAKLSIDKGI